LTISYLSGGKSISAELFSPAGTARGAAVVIAHGSDGVTDDLNGPWASMMREYGADFAQAGYTALLPHYFDKTGTEPGKPAMQAMFVHLPAWQQALADALAHAATLPGVGAKRVGLVGFSLGGHLSLRLRGQAPMLVEFFAPLLTGIGSVAHGAKHVQIHDGAADPIANADLIADVLKDDGITPELHRYPGAGHGFNGADTDNTKARKLSRERTLRFVVDHL
jgi:dienelactone hydrolase